MPLALRSFALGMATASFLGLSFGYREWQRIKQSHSEATYLLASKMNSQLEKLVELHGELQMRQAALASLQELIPSALELENAKLALQADLKALALQVHLLGEKS